MHYYKRNLGDYAKKAGRLSMLQHGSYTLLIDACYDREQFPTKDEAIEWTWASSQAEIEAVEFVLRKFFVLEYGVYVQKRIQEELAEYHEKSETNKRIANERETKRKENITNRVPVVNEPPPNHKPITSNQEPIKQSMSSSPSANIDAVALEKQKNNKKILSDARTVLEYLNKNAHKNFRDVDSTLGPIVARLKEGYTPERLREIALYKIEQWGTDEKMSEYLRPATLYSASKCAQYDGEFTV